MSSVNFFTPITYSNTFENRTLYHEMVERVDDYFNLFLEGKKIQILAKNKRELSHNYSYVTKHSSFPLQFFKAITYFTLIIPVIMFIAKVFLRYNIDLRTYSLKSDGGNNQRGNRQRQNNRIQNSFISPQRVNRVAVNVNSLSLANGRGNHQRQNNGIQSSFIPPQRMNRAAVNVTPPSPVQGIGQVQKIKSPKNLLSPNPGKNGVAINVSSSPIAINISSSAIKTEEIKTPILQKAEKKKEIEVPIPDKKVEDVIDLICNKLCDQQSLDQFPGLKSLFSIVKQKKNLMSARMFNNWLKGKKINLEEDLFSAETGEIKGRNQSEILKRFSIAFAMEIGKVYGARHRPQFFRDLHKLSEEKRGIIQLDYLTLFLSSNEKQFPTLVEFLRKKITSCYEKERVRKRKELSTFSFLLKDKRDLKLFSSLNQCIDLLRKKENGLWLIQKIKVVVEAGNTEKQQQALAALFEENIEEEAKKKLLSLLKELVQPHGDLAVQYEKVFALFTLLTVNDFYAHIGQVDKQAQDLSDLEEVLKGLTPGCVNSEEREQEIKREDFFTEEEVAPGIFPINFEDSAFIDKLEELYPNQQPSITAILREDNDKYKRGLSLKMQEEFTIDFQTMRAALEKSSGRSLLIIPIDGEDYVGWYRNNHVTNYKPVVNIQRAKDYAKTHYNAYGDLIRNSDNKIGMQIGNDGKIISVHHNGNPRTGPDKAVIPIEEFEKIKLYFQAALKSQGINKFDVIVNQNNYNMFHNRQKIRIRVFKRGIKYVPEHLLEQFCLCLDKVSKRKMAVNLDVKFINNDGENNAGVDAGGPSRTFVSKTMRHGINRWLNDKEEGKLAFIKTESNAVLPIAKEKNGKLSQEEKDFLGYIGKLIAFCYISQDNSLGIWDRTCVMGRQFDHHFFEALLVFQAYDFITGHMLEDSKLKVCMALEKQLGASDRKLEVMDMLLNKSSYQSASNGKLKDFLESLEGASEEGIFAGGKYRKIGNEIDYGRLKADWEKVKEEALKGPFFAPYQRHLTPLYQIAKEMHDTYRALHPQNKYLSRGNNPNVFADYKKFSQDVQGCFDRKEIVNSITLNTAGLTAVERQVLEKKKKMLMDWIKDDQTSQGELERFLEFVTGAPSLPIGKKITLQAQTGNNMMPLPRVHACGYLLDIAPTWFNAPDDFDEEDPSAGYYDNTPFHFVRSLKIAMQKLGYDNA